MADRPPCKHMNAALACWLLTGDERDRRAAGIGDDFSVTVRRIDRDYLELADYENVSLTATEDE